MTKEQTAGKQIISILIFLIALGQLGFFSIPGEKIILTIMRLLFTGLVLINLWRGKKWAKNLAIILSAVSALFFLGLLIMVRQLVYSPLLLLILSSATVILLMKNKNVNRFLEFKYEQLTTGLTADRD